MNTGRHDVVRRLEEAGVVAVIRLADRYPDTLVVTPSPQVVRVLEVAGLIDQPWVKLA